MSNDVTKVAPPCSSKIQHILESADFYDAWEVRAAEPLLTPLEQFLRVASKTPKWVDSLMVLRNKVVSPFGLKDLGRLSSISPNKSSRDYVAGDRVGIFTLIEQSENEVLLGDEDEHLKVVLSLYQTPLGNKQTQVTMTTVVHVKNMLGHLYMLPVKPAHHVIAKSMTKLIGKN